MNIIAVLIFKGEKMAKKGRVEKKINENKEEEKLFSPEKKKKSSMMLLVFISLHSIVNQNGKHHSTKPNGQNYRT